MHGRLSLSLLFTTLALVPAALGVPANVTCDDQNSCGLSTSGATIDFISPVGWVQGSTCTGCGLHPDPSFAYQGTWHDTTLDKGASGQLRTINMTFQGTAVYTFFIVPDNVSAFNPLITILTNMSVFLDNELVGNILHVPSSQGQTEDQGDFIYNFLGYANTSLSNDTHVLSVTANNEAASSIILFDYFTYTTDSSVLDPTSAPSLLPAPSAVTSSPPSNSSAPSSPSTANRKTSLVGPVVGGALGSLLLCAFIVAFIVRKRRQRTLSDELLSEASVKQTFRTPPLSASRHYWSNKVNAVPKGPSNGNGPDHTRSHGGPTDVFASYVRSDDVAVIPVLQKPVLDARVRESASTSASPAPAYETVFGTVASAEKRAVRH